MNRFAVGDEGLVINAGFLKGNNIRPPLSSGVKYVIKGICYDRQGNQHLDVGLKSSYETISSYETGEELPDGDKIHWCHPSRFSKIIK
jgi:hypothetical protein